MSINPIFRYFFVFVMVAFFSLKLIPSDVHGQATCVDGLNALTTQTESLSNTAAYDYCAGGTINDAYFLACFNNYYDTTISLQLVGLNCSVTQTDIFKSQLQTTFVSKVQARLAEIGSADPGLILTPTVAPTPYDIDEDEFNDAVSVASESCGGIDAEGNSLKCCDPEQKIPEINTPLPDQVDAFLTTIMSVFQGTSDFATKDLQLQKQMATDGLICGPPLIAEGEIDGNRVIIDSQYNLVEGKEYSMTSYVNAQGTPVPTPQITYFPRDKVKDCRCVIPEGEDRRDYVAQAGSETGGGTGSETGGGPIRFITCSKDFFSGECQRCLAEGKYWLAAIHKCTAVDAHNIAFLCRNGSGDITDESSEIYRCYNCAGSGKVWTALGCLDMNLQTFIQEQIFGWGIGLAGTVALLCIIYSSFLLQTSTNNPEKIKQAQDMLTSCITGLIIIIMSVFILNVIGVDILRIPEFERAEVVAPTPTVTPSPTPSG